MLTRPQQILLKRAQREAALDDGEYREALETVAGCRSSKEASLTDRHLDLLLGYFEAIHWRKVDAGALQTPCSATAVFRRRGFWASKNPAGRTSRDSFTRSTLEQEISAFESSLAALGFGPAYCLGIRRRVIQKRQDARARFLYAAALKRTLAAKERAAIA